MKIYFTASSSGSRQENRKNYLQILETLKSLKHKITNPYYAATVKDDEHVELQESDDVFDTLRKKIADSDCVVAEITVPSTSLGIQIEYALNNKIPVMCLYKKGNNGDLPLMVRDYKNPLLFKECYTDECDCLVEIIKKFLSQAPKTRIKFNMFISHELDKYLSHLSEISKTPKSEIVRQLLQDKLNLDKSYTS